MLPLGFIGGIGGAFWKARRARDPKRISKAMRDVPETVLKSAQRHGVVWRLDAHPVDCVEDPKLIIACIGVRILDLSVNDIQAQHRRLNTELMSRFASSDDEIEALMVFLKWLFEQLGEPETKTYWLAKRLEELSGPSGFLEIMDLLKTFMEGDWNEKQVLALHDIRRVFEIE